MISRGLLAAAFVANAAACSHSDAAPGPGTTAPPPTEFGGDRPVTLAVPDGYDASKAYPLLLMLHGYRSGGVAEESVVYHLTEPALARGMLYAHPDGTVDNDPKIAPPPPRFWNDWPGGHPDVDDVGYLKKLIAEIRAAYHVDEKRIFIVGHSNGGAMSYRMACEHADVLAGVSILAGDMPVSPETVCKPARSLTVLNVHGTADMSVSFAGSAENLGAAACTDFWAKLAHCKALTPGGAIDIDTLQPGAETDVVKRTACDAGIAVELWSMGGVGHIPNFGTTFGQGTTYAERMLDFLLAHPKP
jgi:polyhydroxybutyrate depolymerase